MTAIDKRSPLPWLIALVFAAAAGFGAARLTSRSLPTSTPEPLATDTSEPAAPTDELVITPEARRDAGIVSETVASGGLIAEVVALGQVTAAPSGEALVMARVDGTVVRMLKQVGDVVRADEALAVIESRDAAQMAAERTAASARAELAQKVLARERYLYEQKVSPRMDLEQAEAEAAAATAEVRRAQAAATAANLGPDGRSVVVKSPISGVVSAQRAAIGAFIQADTELFRVADPHALQVEVALPPAELARVTVDDRAVVELFDGSSVEGRVRAITPTLSGETRAATAIVEASGGALRAGLGVRVRILNAQAGAAPGVVVPEDALQTLDGRDVVFEQTAIGFKARPVMVGQRSAGRVQLVSGLEPGVTIATRNAFLLKAELGKGAGEED